MVILKLKNALQYLLSCYHYFPRYKSVFNETAKAELKTNKQASKTMVCFITLLEQVITLDTYNIECMYNVYCIT